MPLTRKPNRVAPAVKRETNANPLLSRWPAAFRIPPFERIEPKHFKPALNAAFRTHREEIKSIAANPGKPTFANTILALEKSGEDLSRVAGVFFNLEATDSTPEMQAIAREMAPRFAAHETQIHLDQKLFKRIDDLYERRASLKLTGEQLRVLERHHLAFVRAGARLSSTAKARVKEINARLASLVTQFRQNVLKDEQSWQMVLEGDSDLAGLPETLRAAAQQAAKERGLEGKHVITLARSSVEGFLIFSARRDLREQAFKAWTERGANGGETDNRASLMGGRVIAVASTPEKLGVAREAGASEGVVYPGTDLKLAVRELTGGAGADVVYDCIGGAAAEPLIRALAWKGRFLVVGFATGEIPRIPLNLLLVKGAEATGVFWGESVQRDPAGHRAGMARVLDWVAQGRLHPRTHGTFPLEQIGAALGVLDARAAQGKVVLTL